MGKFMDPPMDGKFGAVDMGSPSTRESLKGGYVETTHEGVAVPRPERLDSAPVLPAVIEELVDRLEIQRLRNISQASLQIPKGVNLIVGENGSGKTSILEAAYFLSTSSPFRLM